ncbi:MAG TPA: hypothetical protein VJU82_06310 [Acidobacteriaceae bacterium]|nr:hypothetical protein [Acidobacteriaceae bacterium]
MQVEAAVQRARQTDRLADGDAAVQLERQIDQLRDKLKIAVVFAGDKNSADTVIFRSDNTRAWKSYEAVACDIADGLKGLGFRHVELMPEGMQLADRLRRHQIHMAWLNTGGVQGYNSACHAAALLEMVGIPYVGHNPLSATTLDNKHTFKREAVCAGLPTAPFTTWDMARGSFLPDVNSRFSRAFGDYSGPFIVKPVSGRASLNVCFVLDRSGLTDAVAEVYRDTKHLVLIEKYLPGREFCVAVTGPVTSKGGNITLGAEPFAFGVLERTFTEDEKIFTSMDVRPISGERFKHVCTKSEPNLHMELGRLAREVYLEFGLESLIRIDIRSDEDGELYILEANPKPDLKRPGKNVTSLIAAGLEQTNLTYDDLLLSILTDRLYSLFRRKHASVSHIVSLLDEGASEGWSAEAITCDTNQMVASLRATAARMRYA